MFAGLCAGQSLHFDHVSKAQGLPTTGIYDLAQDSTGQLWIATELGGLCSYNGTTIEVWRGDKGIPDASVRCVNTDLNGRVWIGLPTAGAGYIEADSVHLLRLPSTLSELHVRSILDDPNRGVFFGTLGDGLMQLQGDSLVPAPMPDGMHPKSRCSLQDTQGASWWGTDQGLWRFKEGLWKHWTVADGLPHPKVLCLLENADGLWVGTETGLARVYNDSPEVYVLPTLVDVRIRTLARDLGGDIWVGSKTEGAATFAPSIPAEISWYSTAEGLPDNRFRKIFTDQDGTLWFGTRVGGIAALSDRRFVHYDTTHGFPEESVGAILIREPGEVWFGTLAGTVYRSVGEKLETIYSPDGNDDVEITCLTAGNDGSVFIGTALNGVLHWEDGEVHPHNSYAEMGRIFDICVDEDRLLIAGSALTVDHGFTWDDVTRLSPLRKASVMYFSENKDLWIGTPTGLYHSVWHSETASYSGFNGIPGTRNMAITSITESEQGSMWIGSEGAGVLRVENENAYPYDDAVHLSNFVVNFVEQGGNNDLWVGTPDGLHHLILSEDRGRILAADHYDSNDGFVGVEARRNASDRDSDGTIWCGTTQGISSITTMGYVPLYQPPPVSLERTDLHYQAIQWEEFDLESTGVACFSSDENVVSFQLGAVSLTQPERLVYRFWVEGLDDHWRPTTKSPSLTLSGIMPGQYTVHAGASLDGEVWSEGPPLARFEIALPYYATWTFRIGVGLLLLALVTAFVQMRLRFLKHEKRKLEHKVEVRTAEVRAEQEKSERLLLNILPKETAEELKNKGATDARHYAEATVLFTDFKGFTTLSEGLDSDMLVQTLDRYFRAFDALTETYGIEKIKTIGDAYMCAAGIPSPATDHAERMVGFACALRDVVDQINAQNRAENRPAWDIRIGVHSGPIVAGVVGEKKFAYDIWGDTVNIAARMESSGEIGRVNVSEQTRQLVETLYTFEARGQIAAKNKGTLAMFFVTGTKENTSHESLHAQRR